jgi:two-component system, LytTR family, response regulator
VVNEHRMQAAIKTLVVDDEGIARQVLREELELFPEIKIVGEAANGKEALHKIMNLQPDLVFLDLQMPDMGGFEVIQGLSGTHLPVVVIVTAFHQHAIKAFEAGAVDYLLKPVREERLQKSIERAKTLIGKPREIARDLARIASMSDAPPSAPQSQKLVGRIGREYYLLENDEVVALQAEGELVWIITAKGRLLAGQTLRAIEGQLHPSAFQRVHRAAIVNVKHIRKISALSSSRWLLTLSNDLQLVVSKRQAHNVRRILQW